MRSLLVAVLALLVFAPAARADVVFTGVPAGPTSAFTFDVGFSSPGAVSYDCTHVFPDGTSAEFLGCGSPFSFRELTDGRHELRVTATDAEGVRTEGVAAFVIDTSLPSAPVITAPAEGAIVRRSTVTLSGTTEPGTTVVIRDGTTELGPAQVQDGAWTFQATGLGDGPHTFTAVAFDGAGNPSDPSPDRRVTVDTSPPAAPVITAPAEGAAVASATITLSGTSEPGTTVAIFDGDARLGDAASDGRWTFTTAALADGPHTFTVVAGFDGGAASPASLPRRITIDTVAPAGVEAVQTAASAFAFTGEPDARFACRLTGPAVDTGFVACTSPQGYGALAPGDYAFSLQALDAAGNRSPVTVKAFSIAAPPESTPTATPEPAPVAVLPLVPPPLALPAPLPAAELGRTVVLRVVSGTVSVRRPGATAAAGLGATAAVPVGTEIDARRGRVRLTAATSPGGPVQRAEFSGGVFVVTQDSEVVDLRLSEPLGSCARRTGVRARRLAGEGKGRFRARGLRSIITARGGTRWLVEDSCEGTLTRVSQGLVSVRDTAKGRTRLLRAGTKYLARPRPR